MKEIFWNSIAEYNAATWPWQAGFIVVAAVLTLVLWFRPRTRAKIAMKVYMVAVSLWIAFVYYMGFASSRDYSNVMTIFWCLMAAAWVYDLATHFSTFQKSGKYRPWGVVMLLLPLAYPAVSLLRGLGFPGMTTPMIPSAVALYMLGMLMAFNRKINFFAFILIVHWAVIAISKIDIFDLPEDALLAAACIPSMVIFFLRMLETIPADHRKPSDAVVKPLLFCIALIIAGCMFLA